MPQMLIVKQIHPNKFKDKAITEALEKEAQAIANDIVLEFTLATATWKHQPKYEKIVQVGPSSIEILVGTDDEIFGYVDKGTRPHMIYPVKAKALAFPSIFVPKSTPGALVSGAGFSGGATVFAGAVHHPGTKPRNITKQIHRMFSQKTRRRMEKALSNGVKASGHAIT